MSNQYGPKCLYQAGMQGDEMLGPLIGSGRKCVCGGEHLVDDHSCLECFAPCDESRLICEKCDRCVCGGDHSTDDHPCVNCGNVTVLQSEGECSFCHMARTGFFPDDDSHLFHQCANCGKMIASVLSVCTGCERCPCGGDHRLKDH